MVSIQCSAKFGTDGSLTREAVYVLSHSYIWMQQITNNYWRYNPIYKHATRPILSFIQVNCSLLHACIPMASNHAFFTNNSPSFAYPHTDIRFQVHLCYTCIICQHLLYWCRTYGISFVRLPLLQVILSVNQNFYSLYSVQICKQIGIRG